MWTVRRGQTEMSELPEDDHSLKLSSSLIHFFFWLNLMTSAICKPLQEVNSTLQQHPVPILSVIAAQILLVIKIIIYILGDDALASRNIHILAV